MKFGTLRRKIVTLFDIQDLFDIFKIHLPIYDFLTLLISLDFFFVKTKHAIFLYHCLRPPFPQIKHLMILSNLTTVEIVPKGVLRHPTF